eukprot:CAMPEP_0197446920 /NCGR_PEP_ID=MMETSP1175-20131217/11723_1 /TAXON_ID=1003142 /ORGANISM="Triceratium dubium, Strain CCMP147" /LENGTH=639 /DNA_ID=CAMNT_0042978097 /DNA_START=214 /DNA_END=2136 /DNA_ORIENTATION=+
MSSTSSSSARSSAVQGGQPTPEVLLCELRQRLEHLRGVKRQQQAVVEHAKKISPQRCPPLPPSSSPSRSPSSPSSSSSTSKHPSSTSAAVVLEAALSDDPTLNSAAAVLLRAMEETKTCTASFTNAVVESDDNRRRAAEKQKIEAEAAERAAAEFARAAADVSAVFFATCDEEEKEDDGDRDGSSSSHSPTTAASKSRAAAALLNPRLSSSAVPSSPSKALTKTPQAPPADIVVPGGGPGRMGMTARLMRFPPRVVASRLPDRLPAASACATAMHSASAHHAGSNSVGNTCATIGRNGVVFPHVPPRDRLTAILESRGYATTPTPSLDYFFGGPNSSAARSKQQAQSQPSPSPLRLASYGTAVLRSVHTSDVPALRSLLDSGLSPNPCNAFHDDILHIVSKNGDYGLFEALRDAGASYHVSDSLGRTPLHHCCWSNDEAVRRHRQGWLRQVKQQQRQCEQHQQEQPLPQLDARGSLHIAHEMLRRDPALLLLADHRGQTPLDFVPSERWAEWNDFLDSNADWLWPPKDHRREQHEEEDEEAARRVAAMLPRDPPGALSPEEATRAAAGKTTRAAAPRIPEARAMGGAVVVHHKRKFEETATSSTAAAAAYRNGNGGGGADGERRAKSKSKRRTVAGRCA